MEELLTGEGYAAIATSNGREALELLRRRHPDLALLDVNVPGLSGLEVCRRAREEGFSGPVLIVSALSDPADRVVGLEAGADDYITKPFDGREVLARIRAHLRAERRLVPPDERQDSAWQPRSKRMLLAVMFADMKDFSRRVNEDEPGGLAMLRACIRIVSGAVRRAGGTMVEITGDGFLASFSSAVKAVECAVATQKRLAEEGTRRAGAQRIRLRIGIHVGDVLRESGKLRGDPVNIAARLQQICPPGGILVSESVVDAAKGRLRARAVRVGRRRVKNIRQPVTVFRIIP